jgi:uncharacterized membrane protein YjgN (DUF898 family)
MSSFDAAAPAASYRASAPWSAPPPEGGRSPFRFLNRPGLPGLLIKNMLLTIVTLGLYRFWARTALRRYWWSNVVIDDEPLEYTGTGSELFLGFLYFLLIISPFGAVWVVAKAYAASDEIELALTLSFYLFLIFMLLPVAMFRARRYRMSRTRWRGIRGGMSGSTWRFIGITLAGFAATVLSLGVMMPWMRIRQTRYITKCSSFGNQTMSFDGKTRDLVMPWLAVLAAPFGLVLLSGLIFGAALWHHVATGGSIEDDAVGGLALAAAIPTFLAIPVLSVGWIWYSVYEFRYTLNHTLIGSMRLQSAVQPWQVVGFTLAFFVVGGFVFWFFIGVLAFFVTIIAAIAVQGDADAMGPVMAVLFLGVYALAFVALSVLRIAILDKLIVKQLVQSAAIDGAAGLGGIRQSAASMPGSGEGMADAFDLGAF